MNGITGFNTGFSGLTQPYSPLAAFNQLAGYDPGAVDLSVAQPNQTGMAPVTAGFPALGANTNGGFFGGMNGFQKVGTGINALAALASLYGGFKQLSLANKAFQFQKAFSTANLDNSIKTYNTALADRARSRAAVEGQDPATSQAYVDQNKLSRPTL
jgi:hypothetical protein